MHDPPGLSVKVFLNAFLTALLWYTGLRSSAQLIFCLSVPTAKALEGDLARYKEVCHTREDFSPLPSLAFNLK